jgi:hypothetical protein
MLKTILISLITLAITSTSNGQAQKHWKDRAEFDLYTEVVKLDATPAERLQILDEWKSGYPQSAFGDTRLKIYLITYQQLNNHRAAFDTAAEILKSQPNDLPSLTEIVAHGLQLLPEQPNVSLSAENKSDLDAIQKTSRYILEYLELIYGSDKKPQRISDENWRSAKTKMQDTAQTVMNRAAALGQR